jgi:FkbM family methyltransferase
MLSTIISKLYKISRAVENPLLFKLKRQGGLPLTFEKLDTAWFRALDIDTVIDIGANVGQFTKTISALLPHANVYAFEPLPSCFVQLEKFAKSTPHVVAFNLGIGASSGLLSFEKNNFSDSSSFLKIAEIHKTAFPFTEKTTTVEVNVSELDVFSNSLDLGRSIFIKIDVQGYEGYVLRGGRETIKKAKLVIVEVSYVTLYESQPLFDEIYRAFCELGFSYRGMLDQLLDPNTGEILQGDAIFLNLNL